MPTSLPESTCPVRAPPHRQAQRLPRADFHRSAHDGFAHMAATTWAADRGRGEADTGPAEDPSRAGTPLYPATWMIARDSTRAAHSSRTRATTRRIASGLLKLTSFHLLVSITFFLSEYQSVILNDVVAARM